VSSASESFSILQPLELLATAVCGRGLQIVYANPGEPTWTDGKTIFIDATLGERDQLAALMVQASLLSAGSLPREILDKIKRDSVLARRYLFIEVQRALVVNEPVLPALMRPFIDRTVASRSSSPAASLSIALSSERISDPPFIFGTIYARRMLATNASASTSTTHEQVHAPRQNKKSTLADIDDMDEDNDSSTAVDMFSVAGGSGPIGRWLQKFLSAVRRGSGSGSGSPGTDTPTYRSRNSSSRSSKSVSTATMSTVEEILNPTDGMKYPEWDMHQRIYKSDWCTVREAELPRKEISESAMPDSNSLRRPLARIGLGLDRCHRQRQGDDIDIDAVIEARIEVLAGSTPDEAVYVDRLRRRRDLSVLILLDISGSAGEPAADGHTVHEQQVAAATALTSALHNLGDRVALYAYNSQGRTAVQLFPVKRFNDHFNPFAMQRLHSLEPGAYSRLGAAIRHGAAVLEEQGGTSRRLLVVLSDGLAYDHGYERDYGAADARRALAEARRRGTGSLCLTIGASTDAESLQRVFGTASHATISKHAELSEIIGALFRLGLRSAEVRRRIT